jgi:hypothetical protein
VLFTVAVVGDVGAAGTTTPPVPDGTTTGAGPLGAGFGGTGAVPGAALGAVLGAVGAAPEAPAPGES